MTCVAGERGETHSRIWKKVSAHFLAGSIHKKQADLGSVSCRVQMMVSCVNERTGHPSSKPKMTRRRTTLSRKVFHTPSDDGRRKFCFLTSEKVNGMCMQVDVRSASMPNRCLFGEEYSAHDLCVEHQYGQYPASVILHWKVGRVALHIHSGPYKNMMGNGSKDTSKTHKSWAKVVSSEQHSN